MPQHNITITPEQDGLRIDQVAARILPNVSRNMLQKQARFVCDDKVFPGKTRVLADQVWTVLLPETIEKDPLAPWDFGLEILQESASWLAINKPIGIAVHPSPSDPDPHTIVNALVGRYQLSGDAVRPGIVHRLDKPTSGVLLIAKTDAAHRFFQDHWKNVSKFYTAIVLGHPPARGRIEGGILRDSKNRTRMTVSADPEAKDSTTLFETRETKGKYALLRVQILTGRTHQIRTHLQAIGFPIVGDSSYGGESAARLYLHATELHFPDPDKKGAITTIIKAPPFDLSCV